jgi:glyoxylase-like metal-dependent hydrolase (beta-lactamase superfamily II)
MSHIGVDAHYEDERIIIRKLSVGSTDNNVYVIVDPATRESVIVDAADEASRILAAAADTRVTAIWETHGDVDHIRALEDVRRALGVPVAIHPADARSLKTPPEIELNDGDALQVGNLTFQVFHTPGHTPGGVCFYAPGHLIAGDTLFPGGPGNTRRPGGNFGQIIQMIREKLFTLPEETRVYPGHGLDTTIGAERPHLEEWIARGW